jgi:hypothetical protein
MKTKVFDYYRKNVYGLEREFFCDKEAEKHFAALTGKKTLDKTKRELMKVLSGGLIHFREVIQP